MDYTSAQLFATFSVGTSTANVSVLITDDDVIEAVEEFDLMFTIPVSLRDVIIAGTEMIASGIIIDSTGEYFKCHLYLVIFLSILTSCHIDI